MSPPEGPGGLLNEMVSSYCIPDEARSAAVPCTIIGYCGTGLNMTCAAPEFTSAMPAPERVMMIFPFKGIVVKGVKMTLITTDEAPLV